MIAHRKAPTTTHPGAVYDGVGRCRAQIINPPQPRQISAAQREAARAKTKAQRAARKRSRK